ncbi:hypothetical protein B0T26DRAFT_804963 [Lasiosphaeria miniovina]|uniref:Uncharacterized protein n=1 Tax=Lasiosphaeria miniovina TaxID=1954250 RepID=A0AA40A4T1_9PEZI|nr:uncharacterized protein B0T26DRAFT_804963 [Lasiosphaeria miniovina]KAK0709185.1 hypothetical protein B0T26DRAFT_804963 [Lasiosphaeria miniovina]
MATATRATLATVATIATANRATHYRHYHPGHARMTRVPAFSYNYEDRTKGKLLSHSGSVVPWSRVRVTARPDLSRAPELQSSESWNAPDWLAPKGIHRDS